MTDINISELEKVGESLVEHLRSVVPYASSSEPGKLGDGPYVCLWSSMVSKSQWPHGIYQNTKRAILFLSPALQDNTYKLEMTFQNIKKGKRKLMAKGSPEQLKEKMIKWFSSVKT
jgi:hypothetical protein